MEKWGVLKQEPNSEWASPKFIILKKNVSIRFLTDFREVNKRLIQTPWPLAKISTILQELDAFMWATSLDLNMGYYHIQLALDNQKV